MNNANHQTPLFGVNVDPSAGDPQEPFQRARLADENALDLITVQDHPYSRNFLETWTLLTALAMKTTRVHVGTNVLNTPLRPPAMLAKMAATLDILSEGRLELGLGAGSYWRGISAYGGDERTPGEAVDAFEETLQIIRGMWENAGGSFTFDGKYHRVRGARPGPTPAHRIRIWLGAYRPRMLRLTGRLADGIFITSTYLQPDGLIYVNRQIDESARQSGRAPMDIRRGYNLMGVIDLGSEDTRLNDPKPGHFYGPMEYWVSEIARLYQGFGQDTFIFWPVAGNELLQVEAFARHVAPQARKAIEGLID